MTMHLFTKTAVALSTFCATATVTAVSAMPAITVTASAAVAPILTTTTTPTSWMVKIPFFIPFFYFQFRTCNESMHATLAVSK